MRYSPLRTPRRSLVTAFSILATGLALSGCASYLPSVAQGPSSSQTAYLIGRDGWSTSALLTVGDRVGDYALVGIPDGLGAYLNEAGELVVLINHELGNKAGSVRAHGATGAFVSEWRFDPATLKALGGRDLIRKVVLQSGDKSLGRLCSADLPPRSAFHNPASGLGTSQRIFMSGEENGPTGRAFAHVATGPETGISYELERLGQASWENLLASPHAQDATVVIGLDDTHPKPNAKSRLDSTVGKLHVYLGHKQASGSEVDKAGLTNGRTYRVQVGQGGLEGRATPLAGRFSLNSEGGTNFLRPEDGAWDTQNPNVFYFLTTDRLTSAIDADGAGRSRLYRLTFDDIRTPLAGGRIDALIDGTEGHEMLDNMTVAEDGSLILQEDVGNQPRLGKVWHFDPKTKQLVEIAAHDPARFIKGSPTFLTEDEESSGVIDVTALLAKANANYADGRRYFLLTVQAHHPTTPELVEGGQLVLLASPTRR